MGLLPRARDEIPEQRDRRPGRFLRLRVDVAPESFPAGLGNGLRGHRAERDALRAPACIQKQDPAPPAGGPNPDPETGNAAVPDRVFPFAGAKTGYGGVGQLHVFSGCKIRAHLTAIPTTLDGCSDNI